MYCGPLFSIKNKNLRIKKDQKLITDFLIYECLLLSGPEVNSIAFNVREFLELFCLVLRLFEVQLHICAQVHCIALLYSLTGMVIVESYLVWHFAVNWSSQLETLIIVREQLWSFDSCHYSLLLIQQ